MSAENAGAVATADVPPTPSGPPPLCEARIIMEAATEPAEGDRVGLMSKRKIATWHVLVAFAAALAGVAVCWVLASLVATSQNTVEEDAAVDAASAGGRGLSGFAAQAVARRASEGQGPAREAETSGVAELCHTAEVGEPCYRHVMLAMQEVAEKEDPVRFPGLNAKSHFEEFQAALRTDAYASCQRPCGLDGLTRTAKVPAKDADGDLEDSAMSAESAGIGWQPSGRVVAQGQWCSANEPQPGWVLNGCGNGNRLQLKVLTYNLFWWSLFGRRQGNGGSAGHLISEAGRQQPFDVMAFQECEGVDWVLRDAGLAGEYAALTGPHAMCIAYRKSEWNMLGSSANDVAEDRADQWYGTRAGMWLRLQHSQTGQTLFFINHHGPLPLNSGGRCGGEATAFNLLRLMGTQAQAGDVILLAGDFNAGPDSDTLRALRGRMHAVFTGSAFGGVDNILSSCPAVAGTRNLGSGGSDHDALEAVLQL